ncbi:MAG: LAGLIDADG family homing endonuclease [Nanoarchaeota archaeon]|nr:LAGLIDADG family homing endonuclease [Nanoarchaeota archaeon]
MLVVNTSIFDQKNFISDCKKSSGFTWEGIASYLGVSRAMAFLYYNSACQLPFDRYLALCGLVGQSPNISLAVEAKGTMTTINVPRVLDESLAELLGILAGDGHISAKNYEVNVAGHKFLDKEYHKEHVALLFFDIFGLSVRFKECLIKKARHLRVYSKELAFYLSNNFGLPLGKKLGHLHIPSMLFDNLVFLKCFLRGLFDTDGSIYKRRKRDLVVSIISKDTVFLSEVASALSLLGFHPSVSGKNLYLYRHAEVERFFIEIQPVNRRHLDRWEVFRLL